MAAKPEAKPASADAPGDQPASAGAWAGVRAGVGAGVRSGAIGDADGLPSPGLSCCDLSCSGLSGAISGASVLSEASSAPGEGWG